MGLLFAGAVFHWLGLRHSASASQNDQLAIAMFSAVVIWVGCFVLCYGMRVLRTGLFPVLFLFLMVPIPDFPLDRFIFWLQTWSAEVSYAVFQMVGVPILRSGFTFALPGVVVEVAKECSGIRSSLVLLITSLLRLHRQGGVLFFFLALAILAPILWSLQKSERMVKNRINAKAAASSKTVA